MSVRTPGEIILGYPYPKPPPAPIPNGIVIQHGPWQTVQDCLEIHEVAKLRGVCRTWRDVSTRYLNSKQMREKLKVPEGIRRMSTIRYLAMYGTPTVKSALEWIKKSVREESLEMMHAYTIGMPLDPGCQIKIEFKRRDPEIHMFGLSHKKIVTSRKRESNQKHCYTVEGYVSQLKEFHNKIRALRGQGPLPPEEISKLFPPSRTRTESDSAVFFGECEATLPPVSMIPKELFEMLNKLTTTGLPEEGIEERDQQGRDPLRNYLSREEMMSFDACKAGVDVIRDQNLDATELPEEVLQECVDILDARSPALGITPPAIRRNFIPSELHTILQAYANLPVSWRMGILITLFLVTKGPWVRLGIAGAAARYEPSDPVRYAISIAMQTILYVKILDYWFQ